MENGIDYIYEYSDLNMLKTRVKLLTGDYQGVILEYGTSYVAQQEGTVGGDFTFEYTVYVLPEKLKDLDYKKDQNFVNYLMEVLISIIHDRKNNPLEKRRLNIAFYAGSMYKSKIEIPQYFYDKKNNKVKE